MYCVLKITSDYSILNSLIKLKDLMKYLKLHNITSCALCDTNLFGCLDFYKLAQENDIKPIFGLELNIENKTIYAYAKNYNGYQKLLKINTKIQSSKLNISEIISDDLKIILPYQSQDLYIEDSNIYLGYQNDIEKKALQAISSQLVFVNNVKCLKKEQQKYLGYLDLIASGKTIAENKVDVNNLNYLIDPNDLTREDVISTLEFSHDLNVIFPPKKNYIPCYMCNEDESYSFLLSLVKKGLAKRLNNDIPQIYKERLKYELKV